MGGIGLGCEQPQPNTTHIRTQYKIQDTHIRNNTLHRIQIQNTEQKKQNIYAAHRTTHRNKHNMHTICTTQNTRYRTHTQTQNSTQRTEHKIQQYAVHTIIVHIVVIFITNTHI